MYAERGFKSGPGALVLRSLESGTGVVPPMVYAALLLVAGVLGLLVVDRLLLAAEARGWINYRKRGLSMGAAGYHAGQLASMITPGVGHLHDAAVEEVQEEEDRGAPPPLF